jgi:hypothetical protein
MQGCHSSRSPHLHENGARMKVIGRDGWNMTTEAAGSEMKTRA